MKLDEFDNLSDSKKLSEIYRSAEKTRNYIKWSLIAGIAFIVLPLLLLPFVIPQFLAVYDLSALGL